MCNLYRRPSIVASYQVSVHLAKQFEKRRFFLNRPIRNKNYLWRPCLLTDRDEMNNLCRRPSIDASFQVSVHLAKNFQRRRFLFLICQSERRIANRNYSAILATLQITSYALGVYIALLFICQLHESLIKLYFKQFSIFQLFSWIKVKVLISFA